jgi:hypothetical protein
VVRMSLAVLVLPVIAGCSSAPQMPDAALAPQTQSNPWVASILPSAEEIPPAPTEKKEPEDCLRAGSIMALWACEKGTDSH